MRSVKAAVDAFTAPPAVEASATGSHSVADFSRLLGGLLPSLSANGTETAVPNKSAAAIARSGERRGRFGTHRRNVLRPRISIIGEPALEVIDGIPSMLVRFETSNSGGAPFKVFAHPKVVVADGFESDPPKGAQQPAVLKWMDLDGRTVAAATANCEFPAANGTWIVAVGMPPDAMVSVALNAETEE